MFGGVGRLARIMCYDTFINIRGDSHIPLIRIGNALDEIDVFQLWPSYAQGFGGQTSHSILNLKPIDLVFVILKTGLPDGALAKKWPARHSLGEVWWRGQDSNPDLRALSQLSYLPPLFS